jgi:hypothetical protein
MAIATVMPGKCDLCGAEATFKFTDAKNGKCFDCPKCLKYEVKNDAARLIRKGGINLVQLSVEAAAVAHAGRVLRIWLDLNGPNGGELRRDPVDPSAIDYFKG